MSPLHIAIDGPVASGKSTVAAALARRLGIAFLDTGALYRAVAWLALARGVAPDDEAGVVALIEQETPEITAAPDGHARVRIGGRELDGELFAPEIARAVSPIAALPRVRERLVPAQRAFADGRDVVMAGRDIGTVILPDARIKFFLTADLDTRVDRRLRELEERGGTVDRAGLRTQVEKRDSRDSGRAVSPLVKASDAIEIDTSALTLEQVVEALERRVRAIEPSGA
jgi:CMP/dCMP kinase